MISTNTFQHTISFKFNLKLVVCWSVFVQINIEDFYSPLLLLDKKPIVNFTHAQRAYLSDSNHNDTVLFLYNHYMTSSRLSKQNTAIVLAFTMASMIHDTTARPNSRQCLLHTRVRCAKFDLLTHALLNLRSVGYELHTIIICIRCDLYYRCHEIFQSNAAPFYCV